jgi:hypothetical protein
MQVFSKANHVKELQNQEKPMRMIISFIDPWVSRFGTKEYIHLQTWRTQEQQPVLKSVKPATENILLFSL